MKSKTTIIGLMLFALFFGAGNLIYPPTLGMEAGTSYLPALIGFIFTGVGLPILAVVAIALSKNKAAELGLRVHPTFSIIFSALIYLAIGPFFGIPRAANVGFEMGIYPFFQTPFNNNAFLLFLFTFCYFVLVYLLSLNPSKLVNRIGQWLTPILVIAITALSIGAFFILNSPVQAPTDKYKESPFFTGFIEGYLTMDAIAALAFGIIVVTALRETGVKSNKQMVFSTLEAGLVSGIALTLVYGSLGWIGTRMSTLGSFDNGGQILSTAADTIFGSWGKLLLGIIVILACLTTSVGLTVACGQFFSKKLSISYHVIITLITILSMLFANLGLTKIISISVPVLVAIYPVAIVLILLTLVHAPSTVSKWAILFTGVISMYDGLVTFGIDFDSITSIIKKLPFFSIGMAWLLPAIIGAIIGLLHMLIFPQKRFNEN